MAVQIFYYSHFSGILIISAQGLRPQDKNPMKMYSVLV